MPAAGIDSSAPDSHRIDTLADRIACAAREDGLVLFVGAGINGEAGCGWQELVSTVLERALKSTLGPVPPGDSQLQAILSAIRERYRFDLYAQASIAALLLGPQRHASVLRAAVYRKFRSPNVCFDRLTNLCRAARQRPSLAAVDAANFGYLISIARLCLCRQIVAVVTYNYDTLLEHAIRSISESAAPGTAPRRTPVTVPRQSGLRVRKTIRDALKVYHVHGCLPPPGTLAGHTDESVVLTQRDYARSMQEPYGWESSSQLHFLRTYPCLFLGLSMTDWNMLRLLESARPGSTPTISNPNWFCLDANLERQHAHLRERLLRSVGVQFHTVPQYEHLPAVTDALHLALGKFDDPNNPSPEPGH